MSSDLSGRGNELRLNGEELVALLRTNIERGLSLRFRARGFSMSPFIKDGDVVTISPALGASPRPGDIVAFRCPSTGKLLVHRAIGKIGDLYLMQGDNVSTMDGGVDGKDILGLVRRVERNGRTVRIGLGPERSMIAFLSRRGVLLSLLRPAWSFFRSPFRGNKNKIK